MPNDSNDSLVARTPHITKLILDAKEAAQKEVDQTAEEEWTQSIEWPVSCTVGPGLEGAIACESSVGYVNGSRGWLVYQGYDIFDLAAHCTFEEVSYLLLHGELPSPSVLEGYRAHLVANRSVNETLRLLMGFPIQKMNTMGALRLGCNLMRQEFTRLDMEEEKPSEEDAMDSDEDSIAMENAPVGAQEATYTFRPSSTALTGPRNLDDSSSFEACCHLVAGLPSIAGAVARIREGHLPLEPDPTLSHAANLLYLITGRRPSAEEERIMDVSLILHADHGMNASTFAALVVASTLSDVYFSVGSGIAALSGPLHGGANERVVHMLEEIGSPEGVGPWLDESLSAKRKIMGIGHRVYKAYDPRARILAPLAEMLASRCPRSATLFATAQELERQVIDRIGKDKKLFPNVDFYSGMVYTCLGIPPELYTPLFAVSRVAGWTARISEYLQTNRLFRPRAVYTGPFGRRIEPRA